MNGRAPRWTRRFLCAGLGALAGLTLLLGFPPGGAGIPSCLENAPQAEGAPPAESPGRPVLEADSVGARVREAVGLLRSRRLAARMEGLRRLRRLGAPARAPLQRLRGGVGATAEYNVRLAIDWLLLRIPLEPELRDVPGGDYEVGSNEPSDHNPRRRVHLEAFQIDRYEVTQAQYARYLRARLAQGGRVRRPSGWKAGGPRENEGNLPVTGITWEEARAFAAWRGMRLPTVEEWEVAARGLAREEAPQGTVYPWGETYRERLAQVEVDSVQPVGTSHGDRSRFGCEDMVGNVREWVVARDPRGREVPALRGGAYTSPGEDAFVRPTRNYGSVPERGDLATGFRCAGDAPDPPARPGVPGRRTGTSRGTR